MVIDAFQVAGITFLKPQPPEALFRRPFVPGLNEISGDIDSNNFSSQPGQWNRRGAVPTAEIQGPQRRPDPERFYDGLTGFAHERGNRGEITLFPKCFVRVHSRFLSSTDRRQTISGANAASIRLICSPVIMALSTF